MTTARRKKPASAIGRPSHLYDDALVARILKWVKVGVHGEVAAAAEGVSRTTFYRWIQEAAYADRKFEEGLDLTEYESRLRDFRDRHDANEAFAHRSMVMDARRQARAQQTAAGTLALLERRFPGQWRERKDVALTGAGGGPIEFSDLSDEQLEERLGRLSDIAQEVNR
jgi:transcriptional regulator of acetoin/glycerol metabolism